MTRLTADRRPRWRRRLERGLHDPYAVILDLIGDRTTGGHSPPRYWRSEKIDKRSPSSVSWLIVSAGDDGRSITVHRYEGDPADSATWHRWDHVYLDVNQRELPALFWILVRWFAADWFGLRTHVYFWALHRHLAATRPPVEPRT